MRFKSALFYLRFGHTNLWRRKNRTLLLGGSFLLLALLVILFLGYSSGISRQLLGKAIDHFLGDVAIVAAESQLDALVSEQVVSFSDGELVQALAPYRDGLEIRREYRTETFLHTDNLQRLAYLVGLGKNSIDRLKIIEGENLDPALAGANEILLPALVAENLKVGIGDGLYVEVVTPQGFRNIDYFTVKGIYVIPGVVEIMVAHLTFATLQDVQRLMNEGEEMVTNVIVYARDRNRGLVMKDFISRTLSFGAYRIMNYQEYGTMLVAIMSIFVSLGWVIGIIAIVIIAVFFLDTMLATVEERKREYGIMISMGLSKRQLTLLVLSETAIFALYFVLPGVIVGGIIIGILGRVGLAVPVTVQSFMGGMEAFSPYMDLGMMVKTFLGILILIELTNVYALVKIKRLNPVEVLKHD